MSEPSADGMDPPKDSARSREQELLRRRAERFAQRSEKETLDTFQLVGFKRGETRYGIELASILEIRPLKKFCSIPGASPIVPGVFYHRGDILSAHDLAPYLSTGGPQVPASWYIVCRHKEFDFGLLADEVSDVQDVPRREIREMPLTFGSRKESFLGLCLGGTLLLNLDHLLQESEFIHAF